MKEKGEKKKDNNTASITFSTKLMVINKLPWLIVPVPKFQRYSLMKNQI